MIALGQQLTRLDQAMQTLLKLVVEGGSSAGAANERSSVERAAAEFIKEAKSIEVQLHILDTPPNATLAIMREIAELEQELRQKNALISTIETRLAHWTEVIGHQNKEAQALLDGTDT